MDKTALLLLTANFLLVALLPVVFFRRDGKFTLMWFVTAAPWGIAPVLFIAQYFGVWTQPLIDTGSVFYAWMSGIGSLLNVLSIGLITMTIGTHRIPLALWHQNPQHDTPSCIVTWGSYKRIRHPFYSAFIMAFIACILIAPHWSLALLGLYTTLMLNYTAAKEEGRLATEQGRFGEEYREYIKRTGRFFPRFNTRRNSLLPQSN
ncbi:MAG: isoprenylcysteine carboxylmethyltransferase family protein [Gammaproteobacteria bacterium]|nr:isoprenylcysteine carboxylmethyltransferase family protein [Gammaproteobacteria bacterium]